MAKSMGAMNMIEEWTPGKYTIVKKTFGSTTEDKDSVRKAGYEVGTQVTVVEVVEVTDQNRIRGKLSTGAWISLTNTSNGNDFVKKVEELAGVDQFVVDYVQVYVTQTDFIERTVWHFSSKHNTQSYGNLGNGEMKRWSIPDGQRVVEVRTYTDGNMCRGIQFATDLGVESDWFGAQSGKLKIFHAHLNKTIIGINVDGTPRCSKILGVVQVEITDPNMTQMQMKPLVHLECSNAKAGHILVAHMITPMNAETCICSTCGSFPPVFSNSQACAICREFFCINCQQGG